VPFLSKVTGVPMVALATRVALGETLAALGWSGGLRPAPGFVAVKAPVFSSAKLVGVDPALGPQMRSTGEVIGIGETERVAVAKALLAAGLLPPPASDGRDVAVVSVADRDKPALPALALALVSAGYRLAATTGTAAALRTLGHEVLELARRGEPRTDRPDIIETMQRGSVALVVNTPAPSVGPVRDAAEIRLASVALGVLCLSSIETAIAAARALDPALRDRLGDVRRLDEWVPVADRPRMETAAA
jgi:carbamoyl-phosphate synthase large subunit